MTSSEFLTAVAFLVATMALAATVELALPLFASTRSAPGRRATNLGMTVQAVPGARPATGCACAFRSYRGWIASPS